VTICLLAFSGVFCYNEITQIRCSDLQFSSTDVRVRVQHSKTDQYRDGDEVLIARTGSSVCPVAMLERYMAIAYLTPAVAGADSGGGSWGSMDPPSVFIGIYI